MRYEAEVAFIASIYPGQLPPIRRHYGPSLNGDGTGTQRSTLFKLDPIKRGEAPFVMPLYDSFESILDILALSAQKNNPQKPMLGKPVPVQTIVDDLLREWTGGLVGVPEGAKPGVIQMHVMPHQMKKFWHDQPETYPKVSPEEMEQMLGAQTLYFEYLFTEGERLHKQNDWKNITGTMRLAADWLGYEREWSHRAIARDAGPCPFCQSLISNAAIVCSHCGRQVKAIPAHLAALNPGMGAETEA